MQYLLNRKLFVHMTSTIPQHHLPTSKSVNVIAQVSVWPEYDGRVFRQSLYYLLGVTACYHDVGYRLGSCRRVYVTYHRMPRVGLNKLLEIFGGTTLCQRARGVQVWDEYGFLWAENLVCFAHEVHPAHNDDVGICRCSLLCQCQTVSNEVGHLLYYALRVIMRHDKRIFFFAHPAYFRFDVCLFRNGFVYKTQFQPFLVYHVYIVIMRENAMMFLKQ